jgi:DNA-binding transcriptional MocR family regulator
MWQPDLADSTKPRYVAIADAIARDTASGRLHPGTRLPTHRELAESIGVTVGTITRAYAEAARRGLISGEVGRGTFVRSATSSSNLLIDRINVDLSVNHPPSGGPETRQILAETLATIAAHPDLDRLMVYPPDGGLPEHRAAGATWIASAGLAATPETVVVSSGIQHGLTAVLAALLDPGDLLVTESLTYPGMKALAGLLHLRLQGLAMDEHGLRPDAFESACRAGTVKALYCVPTLHNPTTSVMPAERRREIAALARAHGVVIVEDDVHGPLHASPPPPLASYAPELSFHLRGTGKCLTPGLRIGFIVAPPARVARLAASIRTTTWMAAPLMAEVMAVWIRNGTAERIVARQRTEAAARQRLAAQALCGLRYDAQPHGYHLWLHLPEPWRSETFAEQAARRGVRVTPSQTFLVGRASPPHAVRVCLGAAPDHARLERALRILVDLLEGPPDTGAVM